MQTAIDGVIGATVAGLSVASGYRAAVSSTSVAAAWSTRTERLRHRLRILTVIAGSEFKLKYAGSVFGYAWSVIKPLALFTVLYLVFTRVFRLGSISDYYAVSLLIGIVLFGFFSDATSLGMTSLVARESLLRKLVFPRLVIPMAATITAALTFLVNSVVVVGFVAWEQITPRLDWLLVIPLLAELYCFTLGVALTLATLFVRFRDMGQVWELGLQLLFYASPIIYPIGFLPPFARDLVFLNPFTQVLQDIRALVLYPDLPANTITADQAFETFGRLIPIGIACATLVLGLLLFKREEPWFAERV
jgi:ABC-2 type transport system permease protein